MRRDERLEAVSEREPFSVDVSLYDDPIGVIVQSLDDFASTSEEGAGAILGTEENALIPEGGDAMTYGDGGAGKTTLMIDLALHLAAGDDWLGIPIAQPRRVLIIENEGPRSRFRGKLRRKRTAWQGSELGGRVHVLAEPWGKFTYADERWRQTLASIVRRLQIEVVICGPLVSLGMETAGTLQDVRAFLTLVDLVRQLAGRGFANVLVHHENKGGKVSGAWEGAGDTLLHVSGQGHGLLRLHVQKARWASEHHATTLQLRWAEGESFDVEEKPELSDEAVAELIVEAVAADPGTSWGPVERGIEGVGSHRLRPIRDGLLAERRILNARLAQGQVVELLDHVEEAKAAHLYLPDDPAVAQLWLAPATVEPQSVAPGGER